MGCSAVFSSARNGRATTKLEGLSACRSQRIFSAHLILFISTPFRYGIPLTISMFLLHWTGSQSVFVVRVNSHWSDGSLDAGSNITAAGYSPLGIMISLAIGLIFLSTLLILGLKKFVSGMPLRQSGVLQSALLATRHSPKMERLTGFRSNWGRQARTLKGYVIAASLLQGML